MAKAAAALTRAIRKNRKLRDKASKMHLRYEHRKSNVSYAKKRLRLSGRAIKRAQRVVQLKQLMFKLNASSTSPKIPTLPVLPSTSTAIPTPAAPAPVKAMPKRMPKRKPLKLKVGNKAPTAALAAKATLNRYKVEAQAGHFLHGAGAIAAIKAAGGEEEELLSVQEAKGMQKYAQDLIEKATGNHQHDWDSSAQEVLTSEEEHLNFQGRQP